MNLASIPSPSDSVWNLGPLPLRAYALAIILGIVVAIWVGERRFVARGGRSGTVSDVAVWAIPFGLVGARLYHVVTNPEFHFGDSLAPFEWSELKEPHASAVYVWEGGLGIWGAIAFGALGAYVGCRVSGVRFTSYIDAVAPGVVLAQAIGRWGNYFNQELMGEPSDRPWAVEIDLDNRPEGYLEYTTFHPTFLYESLWCVGVALVVILADRRWKLGRGRVFALYVAVYTAGRAWIEDLRIDDAHELGPFRLNVWVALAIFVLAVGYFVVVGRLRPGREESVLRAGVGAGVVSGGADPDDGPDDGDSGGGGESDAEGEAEVEDEKAGSDETTGRDETGSDEKAASDGETAGEEKAGSDGETAGEEKAGSDGETAGEEKAGADSKADADSSNDETAGGDEDGDEEKAGSDEKAGADSKPDADTSNDSGRTSPASSSRSATSSRSSDSDSGFDSYDSSPSDY